MRPNRPHRWIQKASKPSFPYKICLIWTTLIWEAIFFVVQGRTASTRNPRLCKTKSLHREEKDKKRQGFDLKTKKLYSDEEKYYSMDSIKYKEINPYKRRSKPEKGNLKPKKARVTHYN